MCINIIEMDILKTLEIDEMTPLTTKLTDEGDETLPNFDL